MLHGDLETVAMILRQGRINPNVADALGETPLLLAARRCGLGLCIGLKRVVGCGFLARVERYATDSLSKFAKVCVARALSLFLFFPSGAFEMHREAPMHPLHLALCTPWCWRIGVSPRGVQNCGETGALRNCSTVSCVLVSCALNSCALVSLRWLM